jgi:hypothetical protein
MSTEWGHHRADISPDYSTLEAFQCLRKPALVVGTSLRAESDQHSDVGGVALGETAVAAVGGEPRLGVGAVGVVAVLASLATRTTDPREGHANVVARDTGDVALVESVVGEAALEESATSTVGLSAATVLAVDTSSNPSLGDGSRPGASRAHVSTAGETTGASLPLGGDVEATVVLEPEFMVGRDLRKRGQSDEGDGDKGWELHV